MVEQRAIPVSLEAELVSQKREYELTNDRMHLYRITMRCQDEVVVFAVR
jgi:hypothetical protein